MHLNGTGDQQAFQHPGRGWARRLSLRHRACRTYSTGGFSGSRNRTRRAWRISSATAWERHVAPPDPLEQHACLAPRSASRQVRGLIPKLLAFGQGRGSVRTSCRCRLASPEGIGPIRASGCAGARRPAPARRCRARSAPVRGGRLCRDPRPRGRRACRVPVLRPRPAPRRGGASPRSERSAGIRVARRRRSRSGPSRRWQAPARFLGPGGRCEPEPSARRPRRSPRGVSRQARPASVSLAVASLRGGTGSPQLRLKRRDP